MLILKAMGCGRSKHHSPKLGDEEREININKEKANGKKKKGKAEKKENKDPSAGGKSTNTKSTTLKLSPVKSIVNSLKPPPPPSTNCSPTCHTGLHLDIDQPKPKPVKESKPMDQLLVPGKKDAKEFGCRSNIKITSSQIAFFKMLDEKIEQGEDYASEHSIDLSEGDDS